MSYSDSDSSSDEIVLREQPPPPSEPPQPPAPPTPPSPPAPDAPEPPPMPPPSSSAPKLSARDILLAKKKRDAANAATSIPQAASIPAPTPAAPQPSRPAAPPSNSLPSSTQGAKLTKTQILAARKKKLEEQRQNPGNVPSQRSTFPEPSETVQPTEARNRAERPERTDRPDRPVRTERPDRPERTDRVDRRRESTNSQTLTRTPSERNSSNSPTQNNKGREGGGGGGRVTFEDYISREEAIAGVLSGKYVRGTVAVKKYGSAICFVRNSEWGDEGDVLIEGKENRNRAFDGDVVIVEVLAESEWKERTNKAEGKGRLEPPTKFEGVNVCNIRSREEDAKLPKEQRSKLPDSRPICRALKVLDRKKKTEEDPLENVPKAFFVGSEKMVTGKIVHIWKDSHQKLHVCKAMGSAKFTDGEKKGQNKTFVRFAPYDEKYPHMEVYVRDFINEDVRQDAEGYLVYLEMLPWEQRQAFPRAKMKRCLGKAYQVETETRAILIDHGTDYTDEFSSECLAVIPDKVPIPDEAQLLKEGRRDMRPGSRYERFVCSIDPASARDLDDALSCEPLNGGQHFKVGVHIADVGTFVPFGSALDEEARKRATSVYMVQRVIPMLPRKLCEEHCSLNTSGDKLAFTVEWTMDRQGNILNEWMGQTVIRNQARLAYEDAQAVIEERFNPDDVDLTHLPKSRHNWAVGKIKESVDGLWTIAANIRRKRHQRGALSLNQGRIWFDFEDGDSSMAPKGWHLHETAEANWLVEEFMVLANARVTEKCIEYCPEVSLARYHGAPDTKRFKPLLDALDQQGLRLNVSSGKGMADSLDKLAHHPMATSIRAMAIRGMMLAKYCCTSESADHPLSHFALNLELYTHFTSPIRRYADLVVHRVLKAALEIEALYKKKMREGYSEEDIEITPKDIPSGYLLLPESDVQEIAIRCNERKEEARKAGDKSLVLFYCLYLQSRYNMFKEDGMTNYKERHRGTLMKVQEKSFSVFIETLCIEKELFHDNGQKEQKWLGTNKKNPKSGKMCIEWKEGLYQECDILTGWDILVYYKVGSKNLDYVAELIPPSDDTLITEKEALTVCPAKKPKEQEAPSPDDD